MEVKKDIIVDKSIEAVWEVLGNQYSEAYKWARELYHSEEFGEPKIQGARCNNRTCDTSFGRIQEEIRKFDSKNFVLEYEVVKGFPDFIKQGINRWDLQKLNEHQTKVSMHFKGETQGILGFFMGPMMNMKLNKNLGEVLGDFKHYVENGIPSPGKQRDMERQARKAA